MNKPVRPKAATDAPSPNYDADAYGWSMAQARLIRERRLDAIDWDNVAEEIESVGKSEYRSAESALRVVLLHWLKWHHQPTHRSRSWQDSIRGHLETFDQEIADNPSLKPKLDEMLTRAYRTARRGAAIETGFDLDKFPELPPAWADIRSDLPA